MDYRKVCKKCGKVTKHWKSGTHPASGTKKQRYICSDCGATRY